MEPEQIIGTITRTIEYLMGQEDEMGEELALELDDALPFIGKALEE